ncbi:MAG: DUF3025 domain-containing protein [Pseudomonadota bacterium]
MKTNTRIDAMVPWNPEFDAGKPMFEPLRPLFEPFRRFAQWPGLETYQQLLDAVDEPIRTQHGAALKIVAQEGKPNHFEQHYAPRIYLSGEIQTRTENWHDFFQLLTWFIFPKTKAVINAIHIPKAKRRIEGGGDVGRRSPVENMLSLFDEGGVVITSSDESLLQLIRDFKWKELFWQRREELVQKFDCITFGHAMYEKGLMPYIGMTANTILLHVDGAYFAKPVAERLAYIDERLAGIFKAGDQYTKPRDLNPFPILGMPGWDADNADESYYDNSNYFRPGRRRA